MHFGVLPLLLAAGCSDRVEAGRQIYAKHGCAVCHGPAGRGDGRVARTLSRPPRDFADRGHYMQGASADAIAGSIRDGVGAMPAFRDLSPEDARALAEWIVTLQVTGESAKGGGSR